MPRTLVAALIGTVALACTQSGRPPGVVVYASGADLEGANPLTTVHPLSRQVQRFALLVTLTRYDSLLQPQPYFARSWQWSADRRTVWFALDTALRWHDGAPTTAGDVVFTLEAAMDPATGSPRAAELAVVERVTATDRHRVRVDFRSPRAALPAVFSELAIAPAHLLASLPRAELRRAAYNLAPVGNGPFRFVRRDAGRRWVFARDSAFPASLGGPPRVDRLVVAVVDEPTTKFAGLVSGDLDVAGIAPTMAHLVEDDPALRVLSYPVTFSNAIVFNTHRPPFDEVRVRRAVDALIDRERIVRVALAGYAAPAEGPVPPDHPLARNEARPSAAAADSLLDAAGWRRGTDGWRARNGSRLAFTLLTVGSGDNALEQLVQADLRAHGVDAEIRQTELGAFLTLARAPDKRFDALVAGIPGDVSLSHLAAMFDGALGGGALDYAGFHTPHLDSLFAATRAAPTADAVRAAWWSVQDELAREVPVAWLYHSEGVQGLSRRLRNVQMDLRGEMVSLAAWDVAPPGGRDAP